MREILRYEHVDVSYGKKTVVKNVCFTLEEREILGIVGESGSGKSTVIKAIMGLLGNEGLVTRGDIWYENHNLPELSQKQMININGPQIGMIFQNAGSSFCPIRTVEKQLFECVSAHKKITKEQFRIEALELLRKIGLEDGERVLKCYPFELSGGMQQRVGIAAAMLMKPKILLADEPTSALDVSVQKQVVEELLKVRDMFNTSIIIVSHNIGVINAMADKVVVMKDGMLVEYGQTFDVINSPKSEYTKKLMAAVPRLKR